MITDSFSHDNDTLKWIDYTSILLLFYLLISSIAHINPFSGCSHYLEAIQVVYQANRLTGFSVKGISIERNFQAIFFRILLLLPFLRLALIFFIWPIWYFSRYIVSVLLVCANLIGKSFGRFICFDLRSTFTDVVPWSSQLFLTILLMTTKTLIFKDTP